MFNVVFIQVWMLPTLETCYVGGLQGHGDDDTRSSTHVLLLFQFDKLIVHFDILEVLEFVVVLCSKDVKVFL
jgi:hypothetical protein